MFGRLKEAGVSLYIGSASKINKKVALDFINEVKHPKTKKEPSIKQKPTNGNKQNALPDPKLIELQKCLNSLYGLLKRFSLYPRKPENETQRDMSILVLTRNDYEPDESGGQFCKQLKKAHREMMSRIGRFQNTGVFHDITFDDAKLYLNNLNNLISITEHMFPGEKATHGKIEISTSKSNDKAELLLDLNKKLAKRRKELKKFGEPDSIFQSKISAFAKKLPPGFILNSDKSKVLLKESN